MITPPRRRKLLLKMSRETDLALLRRFEPIVRYTKGEIFFPMDVAPYVRACSLWVQPPHKEPGC